MVRFEWFGVVIETTGPVIAVAILVVFAVLGGIAWAVTKMLAG